MRKQRQEETAKGSELGLSHLPDDGSGSPSGHESLVLEIERSGSARLTEKKNSSTALAHTATGPRTPQGKEKSKYNALKHGILSKAVLLKNELRAEYESLLAGFREDLRPEGTLEGLLVERLATLIWRHRRLLVAEGAEILKGSEFLEAEEKNRQKEQTYSLIDFELNGGLIRSIDNPIILERCLELLAELRDGIQNDGFDEDWDSTILKKLYGEYDENDWRKTLFHANTIWQRISLAPEGMRTSNGFASPAECKENFLEELDEEVDRLKRYQKAQISMQANRRKLESLRQNVPDTPGSERLLHYEARLDRAFDRALSQLERLQRMRLGQPVPPPIKVQLSGE